jgi:flagellar motility protein MotE (MotC chaperone)
MATYRASRAVQQRLQDLRDELGSWRAVAQHINRGRRAGTQEVSRKQVARASRGESIRVEEATKKRIRRGSDPTYSTTRERLRIKRLTDEKKESSTRNINGKIARLERRASQYETVGAIDEAEATREEIANLEQFREDIQQASRYVDTYEEYRDLADRNTP